MPRHITWRWIVTLLIVASCVGSALYYGFSLGIDLRGGWEAVYTIKWTDDGAKRDYARMVRILNERVDPTGTIEATVQLIGGDRIRIVVPFSKDTDIGEIKERVENIGRLEWLLVVEDSAIRTQVAEGKTPPGYFKLDYKKDTSGEPKSKESDAERKREFEVFRLKHRKNPDMHLSGRDLKHVYASLDRNGAPAIAFEFKGHGRKRFANMTASHIGERLAVIYNDQVVSAPVIQSAIDGPGVITGRFRQTEVNRMVDIITAGSLDVPLTYDSGLFVGSSLGEDAMTSGKRAILIAGIAVLVFMLMYYLACGAVANLALVMNLVIILGVLSYCNATLTLPGMAGLLLTIGMAVDANVLVFERIREERNRGRDVETAFKNGYDKAFWTIFDANITTFITAWILYNVGSTAIKGFAVVLMIGIITSMFTALFVTRWVFTALYRLKAISKFNMKRFRFLDSTHIHFTRAAKLCVSVSLVLIILGVWAFVARIGEIFDTEFTGGSVLKLELNKKLEVRDVRAKITQAGYPRAQVQIVYRDQIEMGKSSGDSFSVRVAAAQDIRERHIGPRRESEADGDYAERFRRKFEDDMKQAFLDDIEHTKITAKVFLQKTTPLPGADRLVKATKVNIELSSPVKASEVRRVVKEAGYDPGTLEFPENPEVKATPETKFLKEPSVSQFVFKSPEKIDDEIKVKENLEGRFKVAKPFNTQYIGPQVAGEQRGAAIVAMACALVAIVIYIWFRFGRVKYGLAAIAALAHDVFITVGAIAAFGWIAKATGVDPLGAGTIKIDLTIIAAILTIIGYSLNDTIVVFDRIRENCVGSREPDPGVIDKSLNQVLGRTLLTSMTTFMAVVVLFLIGGPGLHGFALSMMVGVIVGTYSSMFIASPIVVWKRLRWKVGRLTESGKAAGPA